MPAHTRSKIKKNIKKEIKAGKKPKVAIAISLTKASKIKKKRK